MGRRRLAVALAPILALAACTSPGTDADVTSSASSTSSTSSTGPACSTLGVVEHRDVTYAERPGVDPSMLSLDLHVPERPDGCPPPPVVVWVHGGGFRTGDKANGMDDKVRRLTAEGWAVASVDYPLVDDPASGGLAVPHPTQPQAVADAVAFLGRAGDGFGVDGGRLALMGHSAGAFLVAQVGADERYLEGAGGDPAALRCVVPVDTEGYDVAANVARPGTDLWDELFADPAVHEEASPLRQVGEGGDAGAWLLVTRGAPARVAATEAMAEAVVAAGGTAEVLDASAYDHQGVNRAIGDPDDRVVTPVLVPFLHGCLGTSPPA